MLSKYANKSYSQEGEDLILHRIFERKGDGFYVDIGAHHPYRFSNTYLFYSKGWKGINVDASPASVELLKKHRNRDINLNHLVSNNSEQSITFYIFNDEALNTADEARKNQCVKNGYHVVKEIKVGSLSLEKILDAHVPANQKIDFLTIDVEGLDFEVIKSNNWEKYRPEYLITEISGAKKIDDIASSNIDAFLREKKYQLFAKTVNSVFYKKEV